MLREPWWTGCRSTQERSLDFVKGQQQWRSTAAAECCVDARQQKVPCNLPIDVFDLRKRSSRQRSGRTRVRGGRKMWRQRPADTRAKRVKLGCQTWLSIDECCAISSDGTQQNPCGFWKELLPAQLNVQSTLLNEVSCMPVLLQLRTSGLHTFAVLLRRAVLPRSHVSAVKVTYVITGGAQIGSPVAYTAGIHNCNIGIQSTHT